MPHPARRAWLRSHPVRWVAAISWAVVILVGIDFWLYRRFLAGISRATAPTWLVAGQGTLAPELMKRVGFFENSKRSSFVFKAEQKPAGVTRLCAFGDSFTHGDEVGESRDYPTLLQRELDESSPERYEVLNFGVSSFGFHQAFMMWDALGRTYQCDQLLLGPATFFPDRDTSFNHAGVSNPYYLHARYVLDGDDVRLVDVVGDSLEERFEEYVRFVPHLRYLSYDRSPPAFVRAVMPAGETVENPFYYHAGEMRDEADETYRRLVRRMTASGALVRLAVGDLHGVLSTIDDPLLDRFTTRMPASFPYRAPQGHLGPIGNQLLARQFANRVAPGSDRDLSVLKVSTARLSGADVARGFRRPMSRFGDVQFRIDGVAVGHFVTGDRASRRKGSPDLLQSLGVVSLVHVGGPVSDRVAGSSSILDGCFLPWKPSLGSEPAVCLRIEKGGASDEACIGRISFVAPLVSLGMLEIDGITIDDRPMRDEENHLILAPQSPRMQSMLDGASKVVVTINGESILTGVPAKGGFLMSADRAGCLRVRANEHGIVDVARLGDRGMIELSLREVGQREVRVPIASWEKTAPLD